MTSGSATLKQMSRSDPLDTGDRFAPPDRRYRIGGLVAVAVGAVVVGASGFAVWLEVLGSRLSGFRLAELIGGFGKELDAVPPQWVGVAWHLFPVSAGVSWLLAYRRTPSSASLAHVVLGPAIVIGAGLYLGLVDVQLGPVLALVGGLFILAGGLFGRPRKAVE